MAAVTALLNAAALGDQAGYLMRLSVTCRSLGPGVAAAIDTPRLCPYAHIGRRPPHPDVLFLWSQHRRVAKVRFREYRAGDTLYVRPDAPPSGTFDLREDLHRWPPEDPLAALPVRDAGRLCLFQPVSLALKPREHRDSYVMDWGRSLGAALDLGYTVAAVGSGRDRALAEGHGLVPEALARHPRYVPLFGSMTRLDALRLLLWRADLVLSCDSWAACWGIASRKPTGLAAGWTTTHTADRFLFDLIGNKDVARTVVAAERDKADRELADWVATLPR